MAIRRTPAGGTMLDSGLEPSSTSACAGGSDAIGPAGTATRGRREAAGGRPMRLDGDDLRGSDEHGTAARLSGVVPAIVASILLCGPVSAQDKDAGQIAFNNACRTCHTLREGDNRLGPSLHGVIGRQAGSLAYY